jgi:hypothetical protein
MGAIYPNPFNPIVTIEYMLTGKAKVNIDVFNIRGQKVADLLNEDQEAGEYSRIWDASGMNSGIYFIRLLSGTYEKTSKVVLLK